MKDIKFGIITPTYNRPELLLKNIESVKAQKYTNWVHLIIDDSTNELTSDLDIGGEKTIYIKNSSNSGVCFSRNRGIDFFISTDVDYIVFLDDDDFFSLDALYNANKYIRKEFMCKWFVSRKIYKGTGKSLTELNIIKDEYNYVNDYLIGKSIRRDTTHFIDINALRDYKVRFPEDIRGGGEWRFFARLSEYIDFKFFEGGNTYVEFHDNGLTVNNKNKLFIATERAALVLYLFERSIFKPKQIEYGVSVVKHFIKLRRYDLLEAFKSNFIEKQSSAIKYFFKIIVLFLGFKYR